MPEGSCARLPFQIEFRQASGELVVWQSYGSPPDEKTKRKVIGSVEALVGAIYEHRYEAFLHSRLAQALLYAGITHLGADPARVEAAIKVLADPSDTTPVSEVLGPSQDQPSPI
ncbi:hypothetical protein [Streptomyces sp. NPDC004296]|uniref:hypothetical protein n=1 Tax=Streptomyces sp. NPDC004296 TaxID=3364697 RepID=UPI00367D16DE